MKSLFGADVSSLVSVAGWRALKLARSLSFGIVRCYESTGAVDVNAPACLKNALSAGLSWVDVYHFPNCNVAPAKQINDSLGALRKAAVPFQNYWLDIEDGGHWSTNPKSNAEFLRQLVAAAEAQELRVGIYTTGYFWKKIVANETGFASYPLWYAHFDGRAGYSDFRSYGPAGGWAAPAVKQYTGDEVQHTSVQAICFDANWCPDTSPIVPKTLQRAQCA